MKEVGKTLSAEAADAAEFEGLFGEILDGEDNSPSPEMKNIAVGPLSAVSPETLQSVYRVLMWNLSPVPVTGPAEEDEEAAMDFARALRFCFSPAAVRRAGVKPTQCRHCLKEIEMAAEEGEKE